MLRLNGWLALFASPPDALGCESGLIIPGDLAPDHACRCVVLGIEGRTVGVLLSLTLLSLRSLLIGRFVLSIESWDD